MDVERIKASRRKRLGAPPADANPAIAPEPPRASTGARVITRRQQRPDEAPYERVDGRTLRATGRIVPLTTKVSRACDALLRQLAQDRGVLMCEILEEGVQAVRLLHEAAGERGIPPLELLHGLLKGGKRTGRS
jgi:hypothetical protein